MKTRISRLYIIHIALLIEQIFNIRLNQQTPIKYDSPTSNSTGLYTGGISESVVWKLKLIEDSYHIHWEFESILD